MPYSKSKCYIIDRLKEGWHLQLDVITFIWQLKNTKNGMAERVNKGAVASLIADDKIMKVHLNDDTRVSNYDYYVLQDSYGEE
jgi:hypothetical protein